MYFINKGAYGSVFIDKDKPSLAKKVFLNLKDLIHEVVIYKYLGESENIVKFMGYELETNSIFLELCDSDGNKWKDKKEKDKNKIVKGLINGLCTMHKKNISHADIKLGNILIKEDKKGGVNKSVICDMGLSSLDEFAFFDKTTRSHRDEKEQKNWQRDIYSLGITMDNLYGKKMPKKYKKIHKKMISKKYRGNRPTINMINQEICRSRSKSVPDIRYGRGLINFNDYIVRSSSITHVIGSRFTSLISNSTKSMRNTDKDIIQENKLIVNNREVGEKAIISSLNRNDIIRNKRKSFFLIGLFIVNSVFGGGFNIKLLNDNLSSVDDARFNKIIRMYLEDQTFIEDLFKQDF